MTAYFRKKDDLRHGAFDTQSQGNKLYTQFSMSQANSSQVYQHRNSGINNGQPIIHTQEASQNQSSDMPLESASLESTHLVNVKREIDLLELCKDINEDTFRRANDNRKIKMETGKQRKVQGTGKFSFTKKQTAENIVKESTKRGKKSAAEANIDVLEPKVNRKYKLTPGKNNAAMGNIANFLGCKQEDTKGDTDMLVEQVDRQACTQRNKIKITHVGEFASTASFANFFSKVESQVNQSPLENIPKNKKINKKRKPAQITPATIFNDELDEQDLQYDGQGSKEPNKKRKVGSKEYQKSNELLNTSNSFLKPQPRQSTNQKGLNSSFMIKNKKPQVPTSFASSFIMKSESPSDSATQMFQSRPQTHDAEMQAEEEKSTLRYKCMEASKEFFNPTEDDPKNNFIIVQKLEKVRSNGVSWLIAQIAHCQIADQKLNEQLCRVKPKVRILLPPSKLLGDSAKNRPSDLSSRTSNSVSSSGEPGGLIVVEHPIILQHFFSSDEKPKHLLDERYTTIIGRKVCSLEDSQVKQQLIT